MSENKDGNNREKESEYSVLKRNTRGHPLVLSGSHPSVAGDTLTVEGEQRTVTSVQQIVKLVEANSIGDQQSATGIPQIYAQPPVNIPTQLPVNIPAQSLVNIPSQSLVNIPSQSLVNIPSQSLVNIPSQSLVNIPSQSLVNIPSQFPVNIPAQFPVNTPARLPVNIPARLPVNIPARLPVNIPARLPVNIPARLPVNIPVQLPVNIPVQSGSTGLHRSASDTRRVYVQPTVSDARPTVAGVQPSLTGMRRSVAGVHSTHVQPVAQTVRRTVTATRRSDTPNVRPIYVRQSERSTAGGWYSATDARSVYAQRAAWDLRRSRDAPDAPDGGAVGERRRGVATRDLRATSANGQRVTRVIRPSAEVAPPAGVNAQPTVSRGQPGVGGQMTSGARAPAASKGDREPSVSSVKRALTGNHSSVKDVMVCVEPHALSPPRTEKEVSDTKPTRNRNTSEVNGLSSANRHDVPLSSSSSMDAEIQLSKLQNQANKPGNFIFYIINNF